MTIVVRKAGTPSWEPIEDPEGKFSSGIPDLDRVLEVGYRRGGFALFTIDGTVTVEELHLLFTPTWINFLYQSRGLPAVLPAQGSPSSFRGLLLEHISRRLLDSRVRIVDYVGEDDEAPYVTSIRVSIGAGAKSRKNATDAMREMVLAEKAVQGARGRPFI
jgi:GvpD gas vesicle protein